MKFKQINTEIKTDKRLENIRIIKECADMLTKDETEILIKYLRRNFKIEIR